MAKRNQSIVRQARIRDNYTCQKCGQWQGELHVHHIIPLSEDGPDTLENVIVLCVSCHMEWESAYFGIEFSEWLTLPPGRWLIGMLAKPEMWPENITAAEFRQSVLQCGKIMRQINALELRMQGEQPVVYE